MTIQIQLNSVKFNYEDIKENYPELLPMVNSHLRKKKKTKRRKRKKTIKAAVLLDEIIKKLED